MKNSKLALIRLFVVACFLFYASVNAPGQRTTINLSGYDWKMTLEPDAEWKNDKLFVPPVDIQSLPVNLPAGGWEALDTRTGITVHLPATVEQYHWGHNGETFGVTGNYVGVSWFTVSVMIPDELKGKRIALQTESVRFRAEIFVNGQLAGYDLVNGTPFETEITPFVQFGKENKIAYRITDPNGNFNWKDSQVFSWGEYLTNPTHGFGGITGEVHLVATDRVYVDDVFVKNKPKVDEIDAQITLMNLTGNDVSGKLTIRVGEANSNDLTAFSKDINVSLKQGENQQTVTVRLPKAKLWSVESPNLYRLEATWNSTGAIDVYPQRFGFRWFEVRDVKGDRQYYLNGKRIVLRTSISWGFWPENGIAPSKELAEKQIASAKRLGLNMLNFHRAIGQRKVMDAADEMGLLYWEEPGGNRFDAQNSNRQMQNDFYLATRTEKMLRMIKRDRSHPSLIIYNMHNERGSYPQEQDYIQMRLGHNLDETRILVYNSCNGENPMDKPDAKFKTHLMPYDTVFRDYGWYDRHHAGGPGVYHDNLYNSPTDYLRYTDHKDEIMFWGEDGAIGTPPRLQLIRDEILKTGNNTGWEAADYLSWYDAYDKFMQSSGFNKAFPDVDALTTAMGNVSYYYQGRIIENIRINNINDGYAINGWESMKWENHSGVVDNYRNPKGDPDLIARYNKPLFVSVKMNRKVLCEGDTTTVDFYIVNEKDLKGRFTLRASLIDGNGVQKASTEWPVTVTGGATYGELLRAGWKLPVQDAGYYTVKAELLRGKETVCDGDDRLFAVQLDKSGITADGMIADESGALSTFMQNLGFQMPEYRTGTPAGKYLITGDFRPPQSQWGSNMSEIMEWVYKGNKLIIVGNPVQWADFLVEKEVLDFRGAKTLGTSWYGGNFFAKEHPLLAGLPVNCAFNWEYQCFAAYNRQRIGLRNFNGETVVACVSDHKKEVYSALSVIRAGMGVVILCSLDVLACIKDMETVEQEMDIDGANASINTFNTSDQNKANAIGQRLLLNMLKWEP